MNKRKVKKLKRQDAKGSGGDGDAGTPASKRNCNC